MSTEINRKKSKAISLRFTPDNWSRLEEMKKRYCESLGLEITTSMFIKSMFKDGYQNFEKILGAVNANI